jgi:mitotic spindle assembly checkpoint protein MAD1
MKVRSFVFLEPDHLFLITGSNGASSKRPLLSSASATSSPRFPQASPSYDATMLKSEYERRELLSKQAYEKLQTDYKASGREIERFKQERLALLRQWEDANSERREEKEALEKQNKLLSDRLNDLQQQNQDFRIQLEEVQTERANLAQASHGEETKQSLRITALEYELAAAKAQAEENKEAKDKIALAFSVREEEWEGERARLERRETEDGDSKKLVGELSGLLTKIHKLESESLTLQQENRILKTRTESIEALKEQNRSLEDKLEAFDNLRRRQAEAEAKIRDLELEKQEWSRQLSDGGDVVAFESMQRTCADPYKEISSVIAPSPLTVSNLPAYISSLRGAISGLIVRSDGFQNRANSLRKDCTEAEEKIEQKSLKCQKLEEELNVERIERLKVTKTAESAKMEVESYVKLLDTFQEESRNQSTQYDAASAEQIKLLQSRLQTMQGNLDDAHKEADRLRLLTNEGGGMSKEERNSLKRENDEMLQSLEQSRAECAALEKQCTEMGKINDELYIRVGRGEFDQTKLRCLELKMNPVSQDRIIRSSTLEALQRENQQLLNQVEELNKNVSSQIDSMDIDAGGNGNRAMVPIQTLENQKREYEKLEQTMRNRDKAFDRLKEAFAAKAMEYVAAVKALFGYEMHVVSKGKVKLRSIYARTSKGTSLTFDSGEDGNIGNMKLVGEARQGIAVGNLQEYWLGNDRFSVPCFLAALQLELYEGTTRAIRGTWEAEEDE